MSLLKQSRQERGWSQARLVSELQRHALDLGHALPGRASLKTMLSRWENGHVAPDGLYRRLLTLALGCSADDLGLGDVAASFADPDSALAPISMTWVDDAEVATQLWDGDMNRRGFLQKAAFSAAALALPVRTAELLLNHELPSRTTGSRTVGEADIATIRAMTDTLRTLDNRYGGGQARRMAVDFLGHSVAPLLTEGRFDSATGAELFGAAAELEQLVGWMSFDVGRPGLGQRHLVQACNLAKHAHDEALLGEILAALSHHAAHLEAYSHAIDLAQAAGALARRHAIPALVAESSVMEAHGHAGRGDRSACLRAGKAAESALAAASTAGPEWITYFDEAYLAAKFGHCFKALGEHRLTVEHAERSLIMDERYARGRVFNLALLAHGHASTGNVEQACAVGMEAARSARHLKSSRAKGYLREVRRLLPPGSDAASVREFEAVLKPALAA